MWQENCRHVGFSYHASYQIRRMSPVVVMQAKINTTVTEVTLFEWPKDRMKQTGMSPPAATTTTIDTRANRMWLPAKHSWLPFTNQRCQKRLLIKLLITILLNILTAEESPWVLVILWQCRTVRAVCTMFVYMSSTTDHTPWLLGGLRLETTRVDLMNHGVAKCID